MIGIIQSRDNWVTIWLSKYTKVLRNKFVASFSMMFLPIMLIGFSLWGLTGCNPFSRGVFLALLWIGLAPFFVDNALRFTEKFFKEHKSIFIDEMEWKELSIDEIDRFLSPKYIYFGVPWALSTTALTLFSIFPTSPLEIKIWAGVSFFLLFLISAMGFYGVYVLITLMKRICSKQLNFRPFHPDGFGGMSDLGSFSVRIAITFSSGALVFPLLFEIMANLPFSGKEFALIPMVFAAIFVLAMIVGFIIPIYAIKEFVEERKNRLLMESRDKLEGMYTFLENEKDTRAHVLDVANIGIYYYLYYREVSKIKSYPWDFKVLSEIAFALMIPVVIFLFEMSFS